MTYLVKFFIGAGVASVLLFAVGYMIGKIMSKSR